MAKSKRFTDKKMNMCEDCDHKHGGDCEDCKMCEQGGSCGCGYCGYHRRRGGWRLIIRVIIWVIILGVVFSAGAMTGAVKVLRYSDGSLIGGPAGMVRLRGMMDSGFNWMMGGAFEGRITAFGIITKIEGNKITFTDNGGKEGKVLSMSGTTIVSGGVVSTLGEIKVGQVLSAYGNLNSSSSLEATWIEVR